MRHRNEEDDFVVKSTGRQRVVFVAIIFVRSLSATFLFFFPSCVATLNPTTESNPKRFFYVPSFSSSSSSSWNTIGFFTFFFSLSLLLFFLL